MEAGKGFLMEAPRAQRKAFQWKQKALVSESVARWVRPLQGLQASRGNTTNRLNRFHLRTDRRYPGSTVPCGAWLRNNSLPCRYERGCRSCCSQCTGTGQESEEQEQMGPETRRGSRHVGDSDSGDTPLGHSGGHIPPEWLPRLRATDR